MGKLRNAKIANPKIVITPGSRMSEQCICSPGADTIGELVRSERQLYPRLTLWLRMTTAAATSAKQISAASASAPPARAGIATISPSEVPGDTVPFGLETASFPECADPGTKQSIFPGLGRPPAVLKDSFLE